MINSESFLYILVCMDIDLPILDEICSVFAL